MGNLRCGGLERPGPPVRSGIDQKQLLEAYPCARSASGASGVDSRAEIARSGISMQIFVEQW